METGTLITEIGIQKENISHYPSQHKFKRFSQTNQTAIISRPCGETASSNCFRLMKKNFNQFLPQEYYECKKVKPGISFYRAILQAKQRKATEPKIPNLQINIPETLILADNCFQLIHSSNKMVKIEEDINHMDYLKIVQKQESGYSQDQQFQQFQEKQKKLYPASLLATNNGHFLDFSVYLSSELDTRIYPKNQNQIAIHFVQPFNDTPNILRLYYTPKNIKGAKPNYGYKIINKNPLSQELFSRKHKLVHNYLVDGDKKQILITPVRGKALQELQKMSQSIINFLQYLRKVKITELVIDFTFGADRCYYFHEIKSIKSVTLTKTWDIGESDEIINLVKEKNSQIYCRLCGFLYSKAQMTHIVTNKLIIELIAHLRGRGQSIQVQSPHMLAYNNSNNNNLSDSSHVCSLCYELIIAQHQLIDLEHQFCSMLNMNSDPIERVPSMFSLQKTSKVDTKDVIKNILNISKDNSPNQQKDSPFGIIGKFLAPKAQESQKQLQGEQNVSEIEPKRLYKWRMFFYIQKVKNIPSTESSNNDKSMKYGQGYEQNQEQSQSVEQYELSLSFNDMKENFKGLRLIQREYVGQDAKSRLSSTRVQSIASSSITRCQSAVRQHKINYFSNKPHITRNEDSQRSFDGKKDANGVLKQRNSFMISNITNGNKFSNRPMTSCPKTYNVPIKDNPISYIHKTDNNTYYDCLDVQKVKIVVFYTTTPDIKNVFANNDLKFELNKNKMTINPRKSEGLDGLNKKFGCRKPKIITQEVLRMKGQSSTLQNFANSQKCQRHSCQVLLFDQEYTYCNLQLNIGIICDGAIGNDQYEFKNAQKSNTDDEIYFPDKMQRNCTPLPEEWIQVFTNGIQDDSPEKSQQQIEYSQGNSQIDKKGIRNWRKGSAVTKNSRASQMLAKRPGTGSSRTSNLTIVKRTPHNNFGKNGINRQWDITQGSQYEQEQAKKDGYIRQKTEQQYLQSDDQEYL